MAGIDATGFVRKTQEEIKAELDQAVRDGVSPTVRTTSDSLVGAILGILSSALAELWELAQEVYASAYPDSASGQALVEVASITGTVPSAGTPSRVYCACVTSGACTISTAAIVSVDGDTSARFSPVEDIVATGAGTFYGYFDALEVGAVHANAGTLTVIETPVAGWTSVSNPADAVLGEEPDDDASLRMRREAELAAQGNSPVDALAADLRKVADVISVRVYENDTDFIDANGLPPHSFEALVRGGVDADIGAVIWAGKAAGIRSYGSESVAVIDGEGNPQTVHFSRPTERAVWIDVDVTVDSTYPADGDTLLETEIADWGDANLQVGVDVSIHRIAALSFMQGVVDVPEVRIGFAADPVGTVNLAIGAREVAVFDTARIVVAQV